MKRAALAAVVVLLSALRCTEPSYPGVGGVWQYTSSLTYPSDFDLGPGQPYVCSHRATLTLTQSKNAFSGTYDSLAIACNSGATSSGFSGTVVSGSVTRGGAVGFYFDTPNRAAAGTVRGDSMGGTVSDSVSGLSGMETATGLWSACLNRACR
jgi:acyl dehydratase